VGNLTGSVFINNIISGAAELPQFLIIIISAKVGRKPSFVLCLLLGGAALITNALLYAYWGFSGKMVYSEMP